MSSFTAISVTWSKASGEGLLRILSPAEPLSPGDFCSSTLFQSEYFCSNP